MKHFRYGWYLLIGPAFALFIFIKDIYSGTNSLSFLSFILILLAVTFGLAIVTIPGVVMHITYYNHDKNKYIGYDPDTLKWTVYSNGTYISFSSEEIKKITNHGSDKGIIGAPWSDYEFSVIELKNGPDILVTCLSLNIKTIIKFFPQETISFQSHYAALLSVK